jgi:hypothetical protein
MVPLGVTKVNSWLKEEPMLSPSKEKLLPMSQSYALMLNAEF